MMKSKKVSRFRTGRNDVKGGLFSFYDGIKIFLEDYSPYLSSRKFLA